MTTKNTTSSIRNALAMALDKASKGELSAVDGKNIIGLANQISSSMTAEIKVLEFQIRAGHQVSTFGSLEIDK